MVGAAQQPPFNTLTKAVGRLNTVGVSGPVTLLLTDDAYNVAETFPININAFSGAGPANPLTLRPAPGAMPVIQGASPRALIVINGADYVTFDGSNAAGGKTRDMTL